MQTLEPTREPAKEIDPPTSRSRFRTIALVGGAVVVVLGAIAVAYGAGRSQSTRTVVRVSGTPPASTSPATVDDRGFSALANGHEEAHAIEAPLPSGSRVQLQHQLTLAREAAMRYPTVADAEAAGWRRAGPFVPGLGVHYLKLRGPGALSYVPVGSITDASILAPTALIYDGTHPSSHIAGLMYIGSGQRIPQGFVGSNDVWHYHTNVCLVIKPNGDVDVPFGIDTTVAKKVCDGVHGQMLQRTPYMLHTWVVAGYDSPQGVFSHESEVMTCRDGTYHMIPVDQWGTRSSACIDDSE